MNNIIFLGLGVSILLITLMVWFKLILNARSAQQNAHEWESAITNLVKQQQQSERDVRENLLTQLNHLQHNFTEKLNQFRVQQVEHTSGLKEQLQLAFTDHRSRFDERQMETLKILQDTLLKGSHENRILVKESLQDHSKELGKRVEQLTNITETKLKEINEQVEKRLAQGFEKTNETFNDVIKRLALIDAAQRKITELSSSVVSLQEILNDKRSRGTFGEVQLSALIRNMIPEQHFSFQYQLSNNRRPDCILFLPDPTGNIAIDAKFPLENYRAMTDTAKSDAEKQVAEKQFKIDIRKHIVDIAERYIIPGETSDGAVMFIPSESIFAEIHAYHQDIIDYAHLAKVWLVSPTTMMAILTTARAVLKDAVTRKQVLEIQKHLRLLGNDFDRFQKRMDKLAIHIAQAHSDVESVHISSRKISRRFVQIEKAEVEDGVESLSSDELIEEDLNEEPSLEETG